MPNFCKIRRVVRLEISAEVGRIFLNPRFWGPWTSEPSNSVEISTYNIYCSYIPLHAMQTEEWFSRQFLKYATLG